MAATQPRAAADPLPPEPTPRNSSHGGISGEYLLDLRSAGGLRRTSGTAIARQMPDANTRDLARLPRLLLLTMTLIWRGLRLTAPWAT